jgi:hypothetical protein
MCRIQLVGGDTTLSQLAERALDAATEIHTATDEDDRAARRREGPPRPTGLPEGRYRSCPVTDPCTLLPAGQDRVPCASCGGCGTGQETAALISPATFRSTSGLHSCSANDTGHRSPSSRFAASWNSSVEYRVLNLPEFLKQKTILPSALA